MDRVRAWFAWRLIHLATLLNLTAKKYVLPQSRREWRSAALAGPIVTASQMNTAIRDNVTILRAPGLLSDEDVSALRDRWNDLNSGIR